MHDIEVEYVTFPGWRGRSTSECRTFNSLPHILKKENNFHFLFINSEMDWCW
jgi:deoxycytidine triphosphate deaminase